MISVSVWKRSGVMLMCSPSKGPASQPGQPPLRAGTYCEGLLAAPAVTRNTVVSTPSRPSAPSARSARVETGDSFEPEANFPPDARCTPGPRAVREGLACTRSLLRLLDV